MASDYWGKAYQQRYRLEEVKGDYLKQERQFLKEFVQRDQVSGPCLEIGCGTGIFAGVCDAYIGLDNVLAALLADGFQDYPPILASAECLPLADNSVQLVFSFNTLEHVNQPDLAFAEIDRVLAPNGYALLRPAWHCAGYITRILTSKRWRDLSLVRHAYRLSAPILKSRLYKGLTRIPGRILRRLWYRIFTSGRPTCLRYKRLAPSFEAADRHFFMYESDAYADIDCHEAILYFESRGYEILSHKSAVGRLFAGHDLLLARKPGG